MSQPGVVVLDKNKEVLYHWACRPTLSNLDGASDRPVPKEIWELVKKILKGEEVDRTKELNRTSAREYFSFFFLLYQWILQLL
jgi:hypothetical protein